MFYCSENTILNTLLLCILFISTFICFTVI